MKEDEIEGTCLHLLSLSLPYESKEILRHFILHRISTGLQNIVLDHFVSSLHETNFQMISFNFEGFLTRNLFLIIPISNLVKTSASDSKYLTSFLTYIFYLFKMQTLLIFFKFQLKHKHGIVYKEEKLLVL